ncbi:MAG: amidase [Gemmatimonadaceae bacterium]|nr:amidase [Gemmatimonadaceae bacterium]
MTYDLKAVRLPVLGPGGIRAVTAIAKLPVVGPLLVSKLRADAGMLALTASALDEPPTYTPALPDVAPTLPALDSRDDDARAGFRYPSVADYHAAYRSGTLTPLEVAERFLAQWDASEQHERPLRGFIAMRRDDVVAQARASAERWKAGNPLSVFDGVPVAAKDEIDQAGYTTTVGTKVLANAPPATRDSTPVARLRAAGAVMVGKANMHEIGIGVTGFNQHYGSARNPYNDAHHTGGSSAGPGCVVGAGLVPVAIGADGGGSIRLPASHCGTVGLKPTYGRVSERGAAPLCWSLAYLGPLANCARDAALAYEIIAGADAEDPHSLGHPAVVVDQAVPRSLAGVTLGVYWPWFRHGQPAVVAACERLLEQLCAHGARLVDVEIPELELARIAQLVIITSEMTTGMWPHVRDRFGEFGLETQLNLAIARASSATEYVHAQRVRTRAIAHFERAFAQCDAIITPASGNTAPRVHRSGGAVSDLGRTMETMRFAFVSNLTGHPAISFPAGYDADGLPIGMQAIGKGWSEQLLLRIAAFAETLVERRKPQRYYAPI